MMPFDNIRVADFTTMLAGAGVCRMLADLGADVIKIETPDGDPWRPVYGGFLGVNRNKRGIVIDLTREGSREIAYRLLSTCDVLVENSRPGIMPRLGMDYASVVKVKPDIVYVSSTAFGSKGPDTTRPGYDPLFQSMSGQMVGQGGIGELPVFHRIAINDETVPALGAFGASLALFHRLRTGQGQQVETSLLNASVILQSGQFIKYKNMKRRYLGKRGIKGLSATNRLYEALDGEWLYLVCANDEHFKALCNVIGLEELATDLRFATAGARKRHDKELNTLIEEAFMATPANIWVSLLTEAGVPVVQLQSTSGILQTDEHCRQVGVLEYVKDPVYDQILLQGVTPRFSDMHSKVKRSAPMLGQHTDEVMMEIGYTREQIEQFKAKKLIVQAAAPA